MKYLSSLIDDDYTSAFVIPRGGKDCFFGYPVQEKRRASLKVVEVNETKFRDYD